MDRLAFVHKDAGIKEGPAICDEDGYLLSYSAMNELFWQVLDEVYDVSPDLFPKDVTSSEDIRIKINIYRSLRRSSDSQAIRQGVSNDDISIVARWKKKHAAKGKAAAEVMHINYADQELLNECFARYTSNM